MGPASQCGLGLIIMQSVGFKNVHYNKAYHRKVNTKKLHVKKIKKTWFDERFGCAWPSKKLPRGDQAEVTPFPPGTFLEGHHSIAVVALNNQQ